MKYLYLSAMFAMICLSSSAQLSYSELNAEFTKFKTLDIAYRLSLSEPCVENGQVSTLDFFQCGENSAIRSADKQMEQIHLADTVILVNHQEQMIRWLVDSTTAYSSEKLLAFGYSEQQMNHVNALLKNHLDENLLLIDYKGEEPYHLTISYKATSGQLLYYELIYTSEQSQLAGKCMRIDFTTIASNPCEYSRNRFLMFTADQATVHPAYHSFTTSQIPTK